MMQWAGEKLDKGRRKLKYLPLQEQAERSKEGDLGDLLLYSIDKVYFSLI